MAGGRQLAVAPRLPHILLRNGGAGGEPKSRKAVSQFGCPFGAVSDAFLLREKAL